MSFLVARLRSSMTRSFAKAPMRAVSVRAFSTTEEEEEEVLASLQEPLDLIDEVEEFGDRLTPRTVTTPGVKATVKAASDTTNHPFVTDDFQKIFGGEINRMKETFESLRGQSITLETDAQSAGERKRVLAQLQEQFIGDAPDSWKPKDFEAPELNRSVKGEDVLKYVA